MNFICSLIFTLFASTIWLPCVSFTSPPAGPVRYVATTGSDSNDGSLGSPWRTIQQAANSAPAGSTVSIRGGTYAEFVTINVSGSVAAGPITFQSYPGEQAVIDGSDLAVQSESSTLIMIRDRSYIVLKNLEIRNLRTSSADIAPIGIGVFGANVGIELRNNSLHHIETTYTGQGGNAHGIAVYGDTATATSGLVIDGNELANLKLGASEALVVNGNVDGFTISNNRIHDVNNIAIDAIGYEGVAPANDRARNGLIADNRIWNVDTSTNPAYGATCNNAVCSGGETSAGGIYVDGGTLITIERNLVLDSNIGIELASEHAGKSTDYIVVRNNIVANVDYAGIALGGYGADPQQPGGGAASFNMVVNNTIYTPAQGQSLVAQYRVTDSTIANNIVIAAEGSLRVINDPASYLRNVEAGNLLQAASGASPNPNNLFVSVARPANADLRLNPGGPLQFLHINPGSAAHNQGSPTAAGDQDFDRQPRVAQAAIDIGADELQ